MTLQSEVSRSQTHNPNTSKSASASVKRQAGRVKVASTGKCSKHRSARFSTRTKNLSSKQTKNPLLDATLTFVLNFLNVKRRRALEDEVQSQARINFPFLTFNAFAFLPLGQIFEIGQ